MCGSPNETTAGAEPFKGWPEHREGEAALKEAGYNGEKIVVLTPSDPPVQAAAALVTVQNLRKAGVNVDAQAMDWSTLLGRRAKKDPIDKGGWHIFHTYSVGYDVVSPVNNAYLQGTCDAAPAGWSCDKTMEELRMAWAREGDPVGARR